MSRAGKPFIYLQSWKPGEDVRAWQERSALAVLDQCGEHIRGPYSIEIHCPAADGTVDPVNHIMHAMVALGRARIVDTDYPLVEIRAKSVPGEWIKLRVWRAHKPGRKTGRTPKEAARHAAA